jgi:LuxR family maltose regulon positive regulatory protein
MPLLSSKLAAPHMPGRVVARPRLFALLDTGVERPVTLLAAPAGSGKTLLLSSWISAASLPGPVAWLSLDPGDNGPPQFWAYVLAALCRSGAVPGDNQLRTLLPQPQAEEALLPLIIQRLDELAVPVVLVLDDLHELTDARVLQGDRVPDSPCAVTAAAGAGDPGRPALAAAPVAGRRPADAAARR